MQKLGPNPLKSLPIAIGTNTLEKLFILMKPGFKKPSNLSGKNQKTHRLKS